MDNMVLLTCEDLERLQGECLADDVAIEFDRMRLWSEAEAKAYFESGGVDAPDSKTHGEDCHSIIVLPDGRRLAYREYGDADGAPIFFMHGNGNSRLFQAAHEQTQSVTAGAGARIFAFDRPGVGGSSPHKYGDYSTSAADLHDAASMLGLPRIALLGYSSGGVHALAAATLLPSTMVTCVGLISSDGPYWLMRREPAGTFSRPPEQEKTWNQALAAVEKFHGEMMQSYDKYLRGARREACVADAQEATRQGWDGMARDLVLEGKAWPFEPKPLGIPVHIWHGVMDEDVQPAAAEFLAKRLQTDLQLFQQETHTLIRRKWADCLRQIVKSHNSACNSS
jgi:pimeloyl-ACP methyl ester carboxylesterase